MMKKQTILTVAAFCILLVLGACQLEAQASQEETPLPPVTADVNVIVEGSLVPADHLLVTLTGPGRVEEILVGEGDLVQKGEVLLRLGDREAYEAALAAAQLELKNATQALQDLQDTAGLASSAARMAWMEARQALIDAQTRWDEFADSTYDDDLDQAEMDVIDSQDALDAAQEDLDQYQSLAEDNPLRTNAEDAYDDAERAYNDAVRARDQLLLQRDREEALVVQAEVQLADTRRKYDARQEGPDPADLALAQARLDNAQAQVAAAQAALETLDITAPMDGQVVDILVTAGERVMPGSGAVLLADFSAWYVETRDLTELEVVKITEGQAVLAVPDALSDLQLTGTVERIADSAEERLGDINYRVRIRLDEADPRLRWGMTIEITFEAD